VETFNGAIEADGVAGYVNNRTVMGSYAIAVHGITRGVGGPNTFGFRADSEASDHCQAGIIIDCSTSNNASGANSFEYGAHIAVANSAGFIVYPTVDANIPTYPFLLRNAAGTDLFCVDAAGNERATSNAVISDERMKNISREFSRGLSDIEKVKPIQFAWKDLPGGEQAGLSAQNVQNAIPESVTVGEDGLLSVSDRPIVAALINAVKELSARVRELESAAGR
jgi:Chaperone of endosialidase